MPSALYIFWILHQTTTLGSLQILFACCISFESYIKPQPTCQRIRMGTVVYLLNPTSNHNAPYLLYPPSLVVYLLNPTSNHNLSDSVTLLGFVVYLLNPTSNHNKRLSRYFSGTLYIFWILHQTTTESLVGDKRRSCISFESYIKPQPWSVLCYRVDSCISFESYIKPQPIDLKVLISST